MQRPQSTCSCDSWQKLRLTQRHGEIGCSVGGYYFVENWMFSMDGSVGSSFPPLVSHELWSKVVGIPWRSEGHLTSLLVKYFGEAFAVNAFKKHRETYFDIKEDFAAMKRSSVRAVRIALHWSSFFPPADQGFVYSFQERIVSDPLSLDESLHVICPQSDIVELLGAAVTSGLSVMLDFHIHPGQTGPAGALMNWSTALSTMTSDMQNRWKLAYAHFVNQWIAFIRNLPDFIRDGITGLQPLNHAMLMANSGFVQPAFMMSPGVSSTAIWVQEYFLRKYLENLIGAFADAPFGPPCIYVNLDEILERKALQRTLHGLADLLAAHNLNPSNKLVDARHIFFQEWHDKGHLPSADTLENHINRIFFTNNDQKRWRDACVEWSNALPRSRILLNAISRIGASKVKVDLFDLMVSVCEKMNLENYFWCWDTPYACPRQGMNAGKKRTHWSLKCALGLSGRAPEK